MLPAVGVPVKIESLKQLEAYPVGTAARSSLPDSCGAVLCQDGRWWNEVGSATRGLLMRLVGHALTVISYPPGTVYEGSLPPVGTTLQQPEAYDMLAKLPVGTKVRYQGEELSVITPTAALPHNRLSGEFWAGNSSTAPITILSYPSTPEKQPMKIEVFTTPAPKTPEPLRLKLAEHSDGEVAVYAVDASGRPLSTLVVFQSNGQLRLAASCSGALGLDLDGNGRVRVA